MVSKIFAVICGLMGVFVTGSLLVNFSLDVVRNHGRAIHEIQTKYPQLEPLFAVMLAFGLVCLGLSWWLWTSAGKSKAKKVAKQTAIADANEAAVKAIFAEPLTVISPPGFNALPNERVHLQQDGTEFTVHTITHRRGQSIGVSVPLGHGVRLRTGTFGVSPVTNAEWTMVGRGQIYLTNMRIVFIGAKGSTVVRRSSILNVTPFSDGMKLDLEGQPPILYLTGDIRLYATYAKLLDEESGRSQEQPQNAK